MKNKTQAAFKIILKKKKKCFLSYPLFLLQLGLIEASNKITSYVIYSKSYKNTLSENVFLLSH